MLAIKLKRIGKKHQASFRIVVAEKRSKLQGRSVEDLGWVNPRTKEEKINKDRVKYWLGVGAQPTPTVWNVLVRAGAVEGKKIAVHKKKTKTKVKKGEAAPEAAPASPELERGEPASAEVASAGKPAAA